jgi:cytoskeletal protein CcmA (bactofilin family)
MNWLGKKSLPAIRSLVGDGMKVQGDLHFREGLRIDGEVHGNIVADGDGHSVVVISEKARVLGKVKAAHVIINGEVRGPVVSDALLELQPSARVYGDLTYRTLEMHPGAQVEGALKPDLSTAMRAGSPSDPASGHNATANPALKLAASSDA